MPQSGKNIHKRRDGRWEGRYKKGRAVNGKIIYQSVYGKSYEEVKEKLKRYPGLSSSDQATTEISFAEIALEWLEYNRLRLKAASVSKYQYLLEKYVLPEFGAVLLSDITAQQINAFLCKNAEGGLPDKQGGLSASYINSLRGVINSIIRYAVGAQMMQPLCSMPAKIPEPVREITILTHEEQSRLEYQLIHQPNPVKLGVLLSLYTGMRIGEVCALSWEDVDLVQKVVYVRHTVARVRNPVSVDGPRTKLILDRPKTKASKREIPVSSLLKPVIQQVKMHSASPYVISASGCFVSPRTYEYRYHKLLKSCGIREVNYHALRHTFATRCIEVGMDIKSLSEILGHANVGITLNTYVHSSLEMKRKQMEKLDQTMSFK